MPTTTASGSPAGALSEFCVLSCSLIASSSCRSGLLLNPTLEHKRSEHLPYVTSLSESGQSPDNTRAHLGRCPPTDPRRCLLRQAAYEYSRNGRHFSTGLSIPRIHSCPSRGSWGRKSSFQPSSARVRLPLRLLHSRQQATRFSQLLTPPRERGTTWSTVEAALPQ